MKMFKPVLASLFIILTGCGGGDDSTSSNNTTDLTGVFLDGPVANIGYKTETKQGVTNALGEYDYLAGESVTFFIGDLEFPAVPASGVVTPLELAVASDTSDPTVVNMIRLLQTLDENADHSDGIQITEEAIAAATQVDFNLTVAEFEVSPAVISLISNAGQDTVVTELISEAEAIQNFEDTLDDTYSVNLTEITASSLITYSGCPGVVGGWEYSFAATEMTLVGTDTWNNCALGSEETFTVPMLSMAADFDIPFNCESYPICTSDDFNKILSGIDEDNRSFTSTYSFDRESNVLTYVKEVEGSTFTEVITWSELPVEFTADWIEGKTLYAVIIDTEDDDNDGSTTDLLLVAAKYENGIRSLDFSADGTFEITTGITYAIVDGVLTISEGGDTEWETIIAVDSIKLTVFSEVSWSEPDSTMFEFFTKADAEAYMLTLLP